MAIMRGDLAIVLYGTYAGATARVEYEERCIPPGIHDYDNDVLPRFWRVCLVKRNWYTIIPETSLGRLTNLLYIFKGV